MNIAETLSSVPLLLRAFVTTLELSILAIFICTVLGVAVAAVRSAGIPVISKLLRVYVEVFRGSPLPITLLFVYFGITLASGLNINVFFAAVIGLAVYHGAYVAEIFRSGLDAVPRGQREAAKILGLSSWQSFISVILPQSTRISLPPLIGQYLSLIKDTSIAFVIGLMELMTTAQSIISRTGDPIGIYILVAALYFVICYPLSIWVRRHGRKQALA